MCVCMCVRERKCVCCSHRSIVPMGFSHFHVILSRSEWSDIWVTVQSIEEFLVVCLGDTFQYTVDSISPVVCVSAESKLPFGDFLTLI